MRRVATSFDLRLSVCGRVWTNPLCLVSGTVGYGTELPTLVSGFDLNALGAVALKGVYQAPRRGNPLPRLAETAGGLLNSIGLEGVGIDALIDEKLPALAAFSCAKIANLCGNTLDEYAALCARCEALSPDLLTAVELNVSCPNLKPGEGGMEFGTDAEQLARVVRASKAEIPSRPLFVKLSPNVTSIADMAQAAVEAGADGLSVINTLSGMAIDLERGCPVLGHNYGGLSGPAIKPVALKMVHQVYTRLVQINRPVPLIGMGGVWTGRDALEFMVAGATAVGIGTVNFAEPLAYRRILDEINALLPQIAERYGLSPGGSIQPLIGALRLHRPV